MENKDIWYPIDKYPPPNDKRIEIAYIQEMLYWDPDIIWQTTGIYKNGRLYSIKYVEQMGKEKDVVFKTRPNHWREKVLEDLEKARELIWKD